MNLMSKSPQFKSPKHSTSNFRMIGPKMVSIWLLYQKPKGVSEIWKNWTSQKIVKESSFSQNSEVCLNLKCFKITLRFINEGQINSLRHINNLRYLRRWSVSFGPESYPLQYLCSKTQNNPFRVQDLRVLTSLTN